MKFEYDELAQPDSEIRIAVVEPGSFEAPIVVRFIPRVLADDAPIYQALSYVWGTDDNPSNVYVSSARHSGTVSITRNLDSALRHLRSEKKPRSLWIDALCINQAGTKEKDVQVMNMGNIFKTALSVIAWLGPEDGNSDEAIGLLGYLGDMVNVNWSKDAISLRTRRGTQGPTLREEGERSLILELIEGGTVPWTTQQCSSVYSLLSRPYFRRAWIVQEIGLAKRVVFQCGYATLPENRFWKTASLLQRSRTTLSAIIDPEEWFRVIKQLWFLTTLRVQTSYVSIYDVRYSFGHLDCSNPRDKIYSVLGMLDASSQELQIVPAYSETTQSVYRDVSQRVYTKMSNLDLMEDCELEPNRLHNPSWVPDWSTPIKTAWYSNRWSACAWIAAQPTFDTLALRCTVSGISMGSVVEVGELGPDSWACKDLFAFLWALRPAAESLESRYITGEALLEVYCRILALDSLQHSGHRSRTKTPVFEHGLKALQLLWSGDFNEDLLDDELERSGYFRRVSTVLKGRRLFRAQTGYLGLAPAEMKAGDILCVLLGSRSPVILRPTVDNTFLVVGVCYAHGLMNGEAIYHNNYTAEQNLKIVEKNGYPDLVDCGDGTCYFYADEMLERAGIRIERKVRGPAEDFIVHVVPLETLRAVGIQVEDFVLV